MRIVNTTMEDRLPPVELKGRGHKEKRRLLNEMKRLEYQCVFDSYLDVVRLMDLQLIYREATLGRLLG